MCGIVVGVGWLVGCVIGLKPYCNLCGGRNCPLAVWNWDWQLYIGNRTKMAVTRNDPILADVKARLKQLPAAWQFILS